MLTWVMRYRRLLGISLLSALVIVSVPARFLSLVLPQQVGLSGVSGTLWSGQAARSWIQVGDRTLLLGQFKWQIAPWRVLWSTPVRLQTLWGSQRFEADLGVTVTGRITLRNTLVSVDAELLKAFFPVYLGGEVTAQLAELTLADEVPVSVNGQASLRQMVWTATSGNVPLGTYEVTFSGEEDLTGRVTTKEGALSLLGEVALSGKAYRVDIQGSGPAALDEAFRRSVGLLAELGQDGFHILLEGRL